MTTTNDIHHFDTRFFLVGDKEYEIVGVKSTGKKMRDTVYTVRLGDKRWEMAHDKLEKDYKDGKLISIYKSKKR